MTDARDRQPGMIILSAGMGSAGSGWLFNLTNDLLVAAGQRDVRDLRDRYDFGDILFTRNCANDLRRKSDVERLLAVAADGHTFVVKTHKPPSRLFRRLRLQGRVRATYIHRDPRDVAVSVFERGRDGRRRGRRTAFARFTTMWQVILWVRLRLLRVCDQWVRLSDTHVVRYEDLRADTLGEVKRLTAFLGIDVPEDRMMQVIAAYAGERASEKAGTHFRGGGRRRDALTPFQRRLCERLFGRHLVRMGYKPSRGLTEPLNTLQSTEEELTTEVTEFSEKKK